MVHEFLREWYNEGMSKLSIILLVLLVLVGCATPAAQPEPTPEPTATPEPHKVLEAVGFAPGLFQVIVTTPDGESSVVQHEGLWGNVMMVHSGDVVRVEIRTDNEAACNFQLDGEPFGEAQHAVGGVVCEVTIP
jgi:hypothetical protein